MARLQGSPAHFNLNTSGPLLLLSPRNPPLQLATNRPCSGGVRRRSRQPSLLAARRPRFANPSAPTGQRALHAHLPAAAPLDLLLSAAGLTQTAALAAPLPSLILEVILWRYLVKLLGKKLSSPEVFFSFRGPDTRAGFSFFLYKALVAAGVSVYWDDRDLPVGEQIEKELLQAIRSCSIAIAIISPRFVESRWCNVELSEIIRSRRERDLLVIPIYYEVNHVELGCQSGKFGEDLRKHAKRLSSEEVLKFSDALTSVARIRGLSSQTVANGHEAELVEMARFKVLTELKKMYIEQLPSILRSVCLYFLEKKRSESKCQVFLVVDNQDNESGFADYLKVSLELAGIRTFSNDDLALVGKDIADEDCNAINQCQLCILILSENFASSSTFLELLVQIFEIEKTKGLTVCPIFLNVMPMQVRYVSLHQQKFLMRGSTYERALRELASRRGWVSNNIANGKQGELVKVVVEDVENLLNRS